MNTQSTFETISNFVNELYEVFGSKHKSLQLYHFLLSKTSLEDEQPVNKHINCFKVYCEKNYDAIIAKDKSMLDDGNIMYSSKAYIDLTSIINYADNDTTNTIWKHLLSITYFLLPSKKLKDMLLEEQSSESNFLSDIINKVEQNVDPNANPMEAVQSIMNSGVFSELVENMGDGLQNGNLDMSKLMGTVQNMVTDLNNTEGVDEQSLNMVNNMMNMMNNQGGEVPPGEVPDMSAMLGPMMNMMNN